MTTEDREIPNVEQIRAEARVSYDQALETAKESYKKEVSKVEVAAGLSAAQQKAAVLRSLANAFTVFADEVEGAVEEYEVALDKVAEEEEG